MLLLPVLYTILGIILFFVILFSFNLTVIMEYADKTTVTIKYLFIKLTVFDSSKPKAEKKKKKEKKKKDEPEAPAEEVEKGKKEKKPGNGLLKQLYLDQGYDGIELMLYNLAKALGGFFGKLYKTFTIDEFYLTMVTVGADAADTAQKYGKLCAWLYPLLGKIASTCKMKKYDFDISPDFLGNKKESYLYTRFHVTPIRITNAVVCLAVILLFKVLFKVLFSNQKSKKSRQINAPAAGSKKDGGSEQNKETKEINENKDGASK